MPNENAEVLRAAMEAFSRRDFDASLSLMHPDVVWEMGADMAPDAATYHGREGVREFFETWHETFEHFELVIDDCTDYGDDHALAITRSRGRGAGSGVEVASGRFVQLAELRDGQIYRMWIRGSRTAALEAAGLPA